MAVDRLELDEGSPCRGRPGQTKGKPAFGLHILAGRPRHVRGPYSNREDLADVSWPDMICLVGAERFELPNPQSPSLACIVDFVDGGVEKIGHEQRELIDAERRASCTRLFFLDRFQNTPG